MTIFNMIVACCENSGIGFKNSIPWFIKNDLKYFSKLTKGTNGKNAVVMGRKTWESLPKKFLPGRENIVLSRSLTQQNTPYDVQDNITVFSDIEKLLNYVSKKDFEEVWIIGGTTIYEQFYEEWNSLIDRIYITQVRKEYACDVFFPDVSRDFTVTNSDIKNEIDVSNREKPESVEVEYQILERNKKRKDFKI